MNKNRIDCQCKKKKKDHTFARMIIDEKNLENFRKLLF